MLLGVGVREIVCVSVVVGERGAKGRGFCWGVVNGVGRKINVGVGKDVRVGFFLSIFPKVNCSGSSAL